MHILIAILSLISSISQYPTNGQKFQRSYNATTDPNSKPIGLLPSILPTPNGPFYGRPYNLAATMNGPFPLTVSGNCEAGKIYTITKGDDFLINHLSELECIYNAGLPPTKVPEGRFNGSILSIVNTKLFNLNVNQFWKGQFIKKLPCNNRDIYIGVNIFNDRDYIIPYAGFVADIKPLTINLAPGEYSDGKDTLITDYTLNFGQLCSNSIPTLRDMNNMYPLNQNIDVLRFVGKQKDGGSIYLGKSYLRDFYRTDLQAATVAYYYIISYDEQASPKFQPGDSLPPLEKSFKYILPGSVDLVLRLLPVDNLLTTPVRTISKFIRGVIKTGIGFFVSPIAVMKVHTQVHRTKPAPVDKAAVMKPY